MYFGHDVKIIIAVMTCVVLGYTLVTRLISLMIVRMMNNIAFALVRMMINGSDSCHIDRESFLSTYQCLD